MTNQLVPKIDRFVDEYMVDLNGTQAAIRAGYSAKTAAQQASRLLRDVKVQQAVAVRQQQLAEKRAWDVDRLVDEAEENLNKARLLHQMGSANGALEFIGKATGLLNDKQQTGTPPVTQIIINLAPGVEMPAEVEGQTRYREVRSAVDGEYREIPEGDES